MSAPQEKVFGLPVITAGSVESVLKKFGVKPWERTAEPIPFGQYEKSKLSEEERAELRFAPRVETVKFLTPNNDSFSGFRVVAKHGTVIFSLLHGDYIPICAEFRHGVERVLLNLPGGLLDSESPLNGAKREFEEETGIELKDIIQINQVGVPVIGRITNAINFSFIGIPKEPVIVREKRLDKEEFLETFAVHIADWLQLVQMGWVDSHSCVTTFLALSYLKKY